MSNHHDNTTVPLSDHGLIRGAIGLAAIAVIGCGLLYSLAGVGLGQILFPVEANGSLLRQNDRTVGSSLVAQPFADAGYFQPRPSAVDHDPMSAAGSNQARTHPELHQRLHTAQAAAAQREGIDLSAVPGDFVTQSGSGIDPHISPQAAAIQVNRIARARHLDHNELEDLIVRHTRDRQLGMLGQPRVNVLELNLALDRHITDAQTF
ncbi:potassium-transporting ATPase subunit KdpC [Alcaligenaceae bacterium SJ-26]|nr:potassium-transporting ATPase subunit KdpC [Alcaligenaceae bacterium SJ-26]